LSIPIRTVLVIALGFMMANFIGCGGGGGGSSSESGTALPARTLSWEPPTSYVDTTAMNPVTDLDRFEIHVNETGSFTDTDTPLAAVSAVDPATHSLTTSFNLANLSPHVTTGPKYYVSLRAVALTGLKSDFSPGVSFSF
jgi:hypothetical protein